MNYEIIVEALDEDDLYEQIYREVLLKIIKECLGEVLENEQSHYIFKSIH